MFDRLRNKALGDRAEEQEKAGAASLRRSNGFGAEQAPTRAGFGAEPVPAPAPGGFGRRKTPIAETTDGMPPSLVANDRGAGRFSLQPAHGEDNGKHAVVATIDDLSNGLIAWLSDELRVGKHVQPESVLCALGALAGYSAQQAIREAVVRPGKLSLDQAFVVIETRSGEVFFFGDLLNAVLVSKDGAQNAESGHASIWKVVSSAGYEAGALNLPDVTDMIKHCAATVGSQEFGIPRVAEAHMPEIMPHEALSRFWNVTRRKLAGTEPMSWPLHLAMAAHKLIVDLKDAIRPDIAVQIVMESAVPMSKIDPVTLPRE